MTGGVLPPTYNRINQYGTSILEEKFKKWKIIAMTQKINCLSSCMSHGCLHLLRQFCLMYRIKWVDRSLAPKPPMGLLFNVWHHRKSENNWICLMFSTVLF